MSKLALFCICDESFFEIKYYRQNLKPTSDSTKSVQNQTNKMVENDISLKTQEVRLAQALSS